MKTKERNNKLMLLADCAIRETGAIFNDANTKTDIPESYNGQIAALGVSIAMSGLRPALAIYYQDVSMRKVNRRAVLTIIARMITDDDTYRQDFSSEEKYAENFFRHALAKETNTEALQREVIECSIALKQVVRTYNLV